MFGAVVARRRLRPQSVMERQLPAARQMIAHAAAHVPAYEGVLAPGDADQIRSLTDLAALPTVDKAHFLALDPERRAWLPPGPPPRVANTSGTSGQPFPVPWSQWAGWRNRVQRLHMVRGMGIGPRDSQVSLTLPSRAAGHGTRVRRARVGAGRRHWLAENAPAAVTAAELLRLRPDWLSGEPHILLSVADELQGALRPKVLTSYGVALDDTMRAALHDAYGIPPLDIYGTSECGQMAWQCRRADLYHVNHEIVLVEIVDDDGRPVPRGQVGQVLLTGLINGLLPMVRYRIGDAATWADRRCACGDPLPALASIDGRRFDWLVDDDGQRVAPQRLWFSTVVPSRVAQVVTYRVSQASDGAVTIEIVPRDELLDGGLDELVREYQRVLGTGTPVSVRVVDAIQMPPGRRFRQFTSERVPES
jgi:phenylacetate-CoA ligase